MAKGHKMNRSGSETTKKKGGEQEVWEGHKASKQEMLVAELGDKSFKHPQMDTTMCMVCEDENGRYVTSASFFNSSILDPYRFENYKRLSKDEVKDIANVDLDELGDDVDEKDD